MEDVSRWDLGYVTCIECGKMLREISADHCRSHGMTRAEYRDKYGIPKGVKLNFSNLAHRWQPGIKPDYIGGIKVYDYCSSRIYYKGTAHIKFNLDHVSGLVCWAGRIENPAVGKDLGFRLKIPENNVTSLCPIKIDSGEMELIRKVGVDHISRASVIESAWPRILTYDKVIKYYGELDQRVKKVLKREDRYVDYKENIEDCTNDKEELKHFTYCDFNQDINLRRYGFAKSMVNSLDKMSAVMFVKAHDELMRLDDEHKVTMPFLLRNMIWVLRPDIRPFFTDGKGGYRFVTIR